MADDLGDGFPSPDQRGSHPARGDALDAPLPNRPWTDTGEDATLLTAARMGDLDAWLRLVRTHRTALWRACMAITRQRGDAEILFQETLAQATRDLAEAPSDAPVLPWLVAIARRLDTSRTRGRGLRPTVGVRRPNGEDWLAGARGAHWVDDEKHALHAYALLQSDDQFLLALRLFERLSYAEISQVTGIPVPRVLYRLALARDYVQPTSDEGRAA